MTRRSRLLFLLLLVALPLLFAIDMMTGSTLLSVGEVCRALLGDGDAVTVAIVQQLRLMKALTACLAGIALAVSGLQMQTLFRNPLAGPYVLGVTSGAGLGVALLLLGAPLLGTAILPELGIAGAAWVGAAAVLALMAAAGTRLRDIMAVLVLGMMLSAAFCAVVQILQYLSREDALKAYVVWTMGTLSDVTPTRLAILAPGVLAGMLLAVVAVKPLNLLLLGEQYAVSMGMDLRRSRALIFLSTTLLAGTVTAFCGPIGFIGLAVPHIARALFATADVRVLLPATALCGALLMLVCDIISKWLMLPVNAVTALTGIPVVIWIVFKISRR